jgi:hypothetical protein
MTNTEITLNQGDAYVVFFSGGPYDGQTDHRVSTDGSWDAEITELVLQNGKETQLVYGSPAAKLVGDEVHVTYTWDSGDSESTDRVANHDLEEG